MMKKIVFLILYFLSLQAYGMDVYCNGAPTLPHPNGGGNVALTAMVDSTAIVGPNASVCEYATVLGASQVNDSARVYGNARISNGAIISGLAEVFGNAIVSSGDSAQIVKIAGSAKVYGNAIILDNANVRSVAKVYDNARVSMNAVIDEDSQVFGSATITGTAVIKGTSRISGTAYIGLNIIASGSTYICVIAGYPSNTILNNVLNCPGGSSLESTSQLVAGGNHTCILLANGRMRCWGHNNSGQLGINGNTNVGNNQPPKSYPYVALGVSKIAAGLSHTCSIINGLARCWGLNSSGQLGNGTLVNTNTPGVAIDLSGEIIVQIAAGNAHTCALTNNGKIRCWGDNTYGQLGYANMTTLKLPGDYLDMAGTGAGSGVVTQIVAGSFHTCALLNTMEVRCWGRAVEGQLGRGNIDNVGDDESPGSVDIVKFDLSTNHKAIQISAGANHTCVLNTNGNVRCWGLNNVGQLGQGYTVNIGDDEEPSFIDDVNLGGSKVVSLSSGISNHTCAVLASGKFYCWGGNSNGPLGYGNTVNVGDDEIPYDVKEVIVGDTAIQIMTGASHSCALFSTKGVRCWGLGSDGQLGYGNTTTITSPGGNVPSQFVKHEKKWRKNEN
ncbi:hypothetical protein C0V70_10125 [Bacteriovorax stolpii]|uniref:RCC1-like domain-containing protein n=1 Tax=Bacteriovorax stolpii TaxID=960 RepID=A0A2K9NUL6_BACTC|nr:hypothetical protein [Bacteriovorax stolpii]AUN98454.1 hypothetical protein C0V70_10125 [Bacteriovorax stolpii]TDP50921.1 alpha-tubulin suppressor-like RCC1 family protein [Bacteriovorax stolpii]